MGRKKRQQQAADQAEKLETMAQAAGAMNAYRPHQQEAYNEGLNQTMAQFQGTNNMLAAMGGGDVGAVAGPGPEGGLVTPEMMGVGQTAESPGFAAEPSPPPLSGAQENDRGEPINEAAPNLDFYGNPIASGPSSPESKRTLY